MTYQELKKAISEYADDADSLDGHILSANAIRASALMSNINEEWVRCQVVIAGAQEKFINDNPEMSMREAEMRTKLLPEWAEGKNLEGLAKSTLELVRSLRRRIDLLRDEKEVACDN